jgi:hypothetical protein
MSSPPNLSDAILPDLPDTESIRQRLAVVTTEASLLRAQLRVSKRLERERERLRSLHAKGDRSSG